jgi:hypothetical protein
MNHQGVAVLSLSLLYSDLYVVTEDGHVHVRMIVPLRLQRFADVYPVLFIYL